MRVSPGVAPVTDIVTVPVVELYEFVEVRFPQVELYRLACERVWGASGGQFGNEHVLAGATDWLIVIVKDEEGATILL